MTGLGTKYRQDDILIKQQGQDAWFAFSGTCLGGIQNESDVLKIASELSGTKGGFVKLNSASYNSYQPPTSWAAALRRDYSRERLTRGL